jgi:endoglucanase
MSQSQSAFDANRKLARAINLPLHLGDPKDNGWTMQLDELVLEKIVSAGFSAIRLAVQWAAHADPLAVHRIDPVVFEKVNGAVQAATALGLAVIVDNHLDPELMIDPPAYRERFLVICRQVAENFKNAPDSVMLELLAEPRGKLDPLWNAYFAEALTVTRQIDPERMIIVGPSSYNNARRLSGLRLPDDDRNLIVSVHHYWPIKFTMQGESWLQLPWFMRLLLGDPSGWRNITWEGTPAQRRGLSRSFDEIAAWARQHDRPIFVGEFGTSNQAGLASRVRWTQFIRELAEARQFSWGYWSFGPTFALYDLQKGSWHTEILQALIPANATSSGNPRT